MKKLLFKIPAVFAMLFTLLSFFYYVKSFIISDGEYWIVSVLVALFSMLFYFIDAIISFVRAVKKDDSRFNYILTLVLIGAVPMVLIFGDNGRDLFNVIWNAYYLLVFVLEAVSIKKAWVAMKADRKKAKKIAE